MLQFNPLEHLSKGEQIKRGNICEMLGTVSESQEVLCKWALLL